MLQAEGDLWGALSLLVLAGALRSAILLLRQACRGGLAADVAPCTDCLRPWGALRLDTARAWLPCPAMNALRNAWAVTPLLACTSWTPCGQALQAWRACRRSGQPDCALAFHAACRQAGFWSAGGPSDSGADQA